jgi:hypothetical protein
MAAQPVSFGRVDPRADALVVAFSDRPGPEVAAGRLRGLGPVSGLLPEAGIWQVRTGGLRPAVRAAALGRPAVASAEWPLRQRAQDVARPSPPLAPRALPAPLDDPLLADQWSLRSNGWSPVLVGRTPRPTVAVLDSGIDLTHPEWRDQVGRGLATPRSVIPGRDPLNAADWAYAGHGTHVAGIVGAPANGVGVVGVAPVGEGAQILPVQVMSPDGDVEERQLVAGIRTAVRAGARILNVSAGGEGENRYVRQAVAWATQRGALIVAAVGNEGDGANRVLFPAGYRGVLGVGAQCGPQRDMDCPVAYGVAAFSQRNATVDVVAPGVDILSSVPRRKGVSESGYEYKSGSSMAAPYVAGVAAVVQAANENRLTPFQLVRHLEATARDLGRRGRDDASGWGAVDVARAVSATVPADDPGEINDDVQYVGGAATNLSVGGGPLRVRAWVDRVDDPDDVYPVQVRRGQRLRVDLRNAGGLLNVYVWPPGTRTVRGGYRRVVGFSGRPGGRQVLVVRAPRSGRYYVDVYARRGGARYDLTVRTQR